MPLESDARKVIDEKLTNAGWRVLDYADPATMAGGNLAIREFPLTTGQADYLLAIDGEAVGVVEAKRTGMTLGGREGAEHIVPGWEAALHGDDAAALCAPFTALFL